MYEVILKNPRTSKFEHYITDCKNRVELDELLKPFVGAGYRVFLVEDLTIWNALQN